MSKVIMVTSFKGGVGKTTVSANLAMALALRGNSVVVVDCDLESRCLDIVLGLEDSSLYNIADVITGRCNADEATVTDPRCDRLHFIPAPAYYDFLDENSPLANLSDVAVSSFVKELRDKYEYVILDLPARPDSLYRSLVKVATHALVVCLHTAASIRAAEKTAMMLADMSKLAHGEDNLFEESVGGYKEATKLNIRLIVNCFKSKECASGKKPKIYDIVVKTSTKLIGVIPESAEVAAAQEKGKISFEVRGGKTAFTAAVNNIARRCEGEQVLLLNGVKTGTARNKLI